MIFFGWCFSAPVKIITSFFSFKLLMHLITKMDSLMMNHSCILEINPILLCQNFSSFDYPNLIFILKRWLWLLSGDWIEGGLWNQVFLCMCVYNFTIQSSYCVDSLIIINCPILSPVILLISKYILSGINIAFPKFLCLFKAMHTFFSNLLIIYWCLFI